MCFRSAVAITEHVYQSEEKWSLLEVVYSKLSAVFSESWKITIVRPSSIRRLAWNTTGNYMDFLP